MPGSPLQAQSCARLAAWLREALSIRNSICHGLTGYAADWHDTKAHLTLEGPDGPQCLTYQHLDRLCGDLSRAKWAIETLSEARRTPHEAERMAAPWQDFPRHP